MDEVKKSFDNEMRGKMKEAVIERLTNTDADVENDNEISRIYDEICADADFMNITYTNALFTVGEQFEITAGALVVYLNSS